MIKKILNQSVAAVLIAFVLLLFAGGTVAAESLPPVTNLSHFFIFPSEVKDNWFSKQVLNDPERGRSAFMFNRKTIVDEAGVRVSPSVSFIFELVPTPSDENKADFVVAYSVNARTRMTIPFKIDKVYAWADGLFSWQYAIGYKVRYNDDRLEHTVYWVHGLFVDNGRTYGVQVIMDSTTSVLPAVEPEFMAMLANIGSGQ